MLIFHCTDCNEEIDCLDHESPDQAFTNLDEHIAKCPVAKRMAPAPVGKDV